jgi:phosphate transport system substrate-binding protein
MHKSQDKPDKAVATLKFFDWAFKNGAKAAVEMEYVPIPDKTVTLIHDMWKRDIKSASGGTAIYR